MRPRRASSATLRLTSSNNKRSRVSAVSGVSVRDSWDTSTKRARCFDGLAEVEGADFMYRVSHRVICLVVLGRVALDQVDTDAARTAFEQAIAHVKGRPRTLGWPAHVSGAGRLARGDKDLAAFEAAQTLNISRDDFDFPWLWLCESDVT